jgi:amino acid transporter
MTTLNRGLGFWAILAYGVGDILGAGIYALVGKIAGAAGTWAWLAFGVSMAVAALTALTYSELVCRFPRSAGEAFYTHQGYKRSWLALLVGWMVLCSGVVSLATVSLGFAGYVEGIAPEAPRFIIVVVFMLLLGFINFWGIRESSAFNIVCTCIEASGLIFVFVVGAVFLWGGEGSGAATTEQTVPTTDFSALAIVQGAALAFFAFIGFQDMVNVAEETKRPARNFPMAIILALLSASVVYMLVVSVATAVVPPAQLEASSSPLLEVVRTAAPWTPEWLFTLVALFAVANTGLLNYIMASRLLYGMGRQGLLPGPLARVHAKRRTPHWSVVVIFFAALGLALSGSLSYLAGATAVLLLAVFAIVNGALLRVKYTQGPSTRGFQVPWPIPAAGVLASAGLIFFVEGASLVAVVVLVGVGGGIIAWRALTAGLPGKPAALSEEEWDEA